ncbi:F-box protein SKIP24 [Salvia miltiorrhiza]|uniref:F-box protein SKIP24 n=1 Tax=Salvia miltiorrhiza TaxID=226208 RepID=UPI0025ABFF49|nr:F-box protein SKIP24 [Salvia miltiorrhiza]
MSVLPDELWRSIMEIGIQTKTLDYKNLCCLSITCRRLRRLAAEDSLWSHLLLSDFPSTKNNSNSGDGDRKIGTRDNSYTSSSNSSSMAKYLYQIRYEKDREKKRLAHRRAILRIESEIAERLRKIGEIKLQSLEEKKKMSKAVAELFNLRRIRQASVAVNVWQPEIIRSRQREMVQQTNVPVDVRINALEMELSLCKQQIAAFDNAIRVEKKRCRAAEEELASVKYHPLHDLENTRGHSSGCGVRSTRLKHTSMVPECFIIGLEHKRQCNLHSTTYNLHMPRLNPILQTEGKILWKLLQFLQFSLHLLGKILQFRLEIVLNTEREERRTSQNHLHGIPLGKSQAHKVIKLGDERVLDAGDQQNRVLIS